LLGLHFSGVLVARLDRRYAGSAGGFSRTGDHVCDWRVEGWRLLLLVTGAELGSLYPGFGRATRLDPEKALQT